MTQLEVNKLPYKVADLSLAELGLKEISLAENEVPGLMAHFSWKDIGEDAETEKPMQFWLKAL